jgi:hypothetical protein
MSTLIVAAALFAALYFLQVLLTRLTNRFLAFVDLRRQRRLTQPFAELGADSVGLTLSAGDRIFWADVCEIRVETSAAGPYDDDFFLVIVAAGREPVRIPSPPIARVLPHLQRLPGFDNEAFIKAAGSTENATFICWRASAPR